MNAKSIIKKVALALAGVAALTAVGFGVKAIVDYTKNDLKTISPSFEVGNLGSDGKFVDDKSTLYTKDAFGCYGLQVKPDFDSKVNYQIFYYDILDNYISSTAVLSEGYSGEAPINGAYARIVIEPKDDEDGKISLTERVIYPKNLTFKVKKEQDINKRFVLFKGKVLQVVNMTSDVVFTKGISFDENPLRWVEIANNCCTSTCVLNVKGGSLFNFDFLKVNEGFLGTFCNVFEFSDFPSDDSYLGLQQLFYQFETHTPCGSIELKKSTKCILIVFNNFNVTANLTDEVINSLPSLITVIDK